MEHTLDNSKSFPSKEENFKRSERDWVEDFTHENGNYQNQCCRCHLLFFGHKRRVICKVCMAKEENSAPVKDSEEDQFQKTFGRRFHHPVGTKMGYGKIGELDWEQIAKKQPPEDNRRNPAWAGAWLEGEMVGFARCMVKYGLHKTPSPP